LNSISLRSIDNVVIVVSIAARQANCAFGSQRTILRVRGTSLTRDERLVSHVGDRF
jgi:hypothetical protein